MKLRPSDVEVHMEKDGVWTTSINKENTILIPQELLDELGWSQGTSIYYSTTKGSIIIRNVSPYANKSTANE